MISTKALVKRSEAAWSAKNQWRSILQEAYELVLPQRDLYNISAPGQRKSDRVFDSTPIHAISRFASRLQNDMTPPFERWFELQAGPAFDQAGGGAPETEEQKKRLEEQLEGITQLAHHAIDIGGFHTASHEMYLDLGVSTGVIMVTRGNARQPVRYTAIPDAQVAYDEGENGEIDGVFRKWSIKARVITKQWPDAKIPRELKRTIKEHPDKDVELCEASYMDDSQAKPWRYDVLWKDERIVQRGHRERRIIVTRWMKVAGEVSGRGPVIQSLPDIKTANKFREILLRRGALDAVGMYTAEDDGVLNTDTIRIVPGGIVKVAPSTSGRPSLQPMELPPLPDLSLLLVDQLQQSIKKALLDNQLPPDAGPVRSATEIVQRMKELAQDAAGAYGRLMTEFINPVVRATIDELSEQRLLTVPDGFTVDNLLVKVAVTSPLARLQALQEVENLVQAAQILGGIGGPPLVMATFKPEEIGPWIANSLNVPERLVNSSQQVKALMEQAAQAMAQQPEAVGEAERAAEPANAA